MNDVLHSLRVEAMELLNALVFLDADEKKVRVDAISQLPEKGLHELIAALSDARQEQIGLLKKLGEKDPKVLDQIIEATSTSGGIAIEISSNKDKK